MKIVNFEFHKFARWVGVILMFIGLIMAINIITMEILSLGTVSLILTAIEFEVVGIVVYALGKIIQAQDMHIGEMKFFRKHFIDIKENKK